MKRSFLLWSMLVVMLLLLLAPYASRLPDGLEKVAHEMGFERKAEGAEAFRAPFGEYSLPGVHNEKFATIIAGLIGAAAVAGISFLLAGMLRKRDHGRSGIKKREGRPPPGAVSP